MRRQLSEYAALKIDGVLATDSQPLIPERSFKIIMSDLDALKSIPAEPDYPSGVTPIAVPTDRFTEIGAIIQKLTSPSSVSEDIKSLLASDPEFFERGLHILADEGGDDCPFCKQSVAHPPTKDRIELYLAYFADAEGKHKKELRSAWSEIKNCRTTVNERIATIAREVMKFEALRKLVPSQNVIELPDFTDLASQIDTALRAYTSAIEVKGASTSVAVAVPEANIGFLLLELNGLIERLNEKFDNIIAAIKQSDNERKRLQREACNF